MKQALINITFTTVLLCLSVLAVAQPTLSSTLTPPDICDSSLFSYTPTSATPGVTFTWSRAVVPSITNPSASGTDDPNEVLLSAATFPVAVTYVYTLSDGTTTNTQNVVVMVNPRPLLTYTTPAPICSGEVFMFVPTSATLGFSFSWVRPLITGIGALPASGIGNIYELLTNNTFSPIAVTYVFTLSAAGCSRTQNVVVTVNPFPSPIAGDTAVCELATSALSNFVSGGIWTSGNAAIASIGSSSGIVTGVAAGSTDISYTVFGTCRRSRGVTVSHCTTEVEDVQTSADRFSVYPNPTRGTFKLVNSGSGTLRLYTLDGRLLKAYNRVKPSVPIELPNALSAGTYLLRFVGDDGNATFLRLINEP